MTEKNSILKDREILTKRIAELAAELTPQMREFCEASLWCETATAAAIHAGYSKQIARIRASKLMADERIVNYIEALQEMREIVSALDHQSVIRMQLAVHDKAMKNGDLKAANTALDQLAKMIGTYNSTKKSMSDKNNSDSRINKDQQAEMLDLVTKIEERSKSNSSI